MAAQPLPQHSSSLPSRRANQRDGGRRRRSGRDRQVRSLHAQVTRACQRNDCPAPARAGVELSHAGQTATIVDLPTERDPRRMELCAHHAAAVSVPRGWTLEDDRNEHVETPPSHPRSAAELGSVSTLEAVTAALHVPGEPASDDPGPVQPGPDDPVEDPDRGQPSRAPIGDGSHVAVVTDREHGSDQVARASVAAVAAAGLREPDTAARAEPEAGPVPGATTNQDVEPDGAAVADGPGVDGEQAPVDGSRATAAGGLPTDADRGVDGVQLALGEAADLARRARPVPAADQD